ncbi:MAG TPA: hypothetical protein PKK12_01475 [Candidatus Aminicenantes bacterium]|nr:hypothetical protein [Candidatus Aminicenantes bacterium]
MNWRRWKTALVLMALLGTACPALFAQYRDMWGTRWNNPVSSFIGTSIYWKAMTKLPAKPRASDAGAGTVTFRPVGKLPLPETLAATFTQEAGQRAELAEAFRQFVEFFDAEAVKDKQPNNVARATAYFIAVNYMVATGKGVTEASAGALQRALQENLPGNGKFQAMTHRQRQELYESFVIFASLAYTGFQQGESQKKPQQMENFRAFARASLKAVLGASPEEMRFTETGLVFVH